MKARAGHADFLGILMLQTRFPRPVGDIGNPASLDLPVRYRVVNGALPQRVVRASAAGLLEPFIGAARELVDDGAAAIATGCGFLALFQHQLQAALGVPVWSSSLLLLPELAHLNPGVLSADAQALTADHLRAAGADPRTPVAGLRAGCSFQRTLLEDLPALDEAAARADMLDAAARLLRRHPGIGAIVLECTNMPPHAQAVRDACGVPVFDVLSLLRQRWAALQAS